MREGVEWAVHCCINLSFISPDRAVPAARLAAFHDLPTAYLNKQLNALGRAGIVSSRSGPRGGFRLGREPEKITLMDVAAAIDGSARAFLCTGIRHQGPAGRIAGPAGHRTPCTVSQAFSRAELAWRRRLARQTIAGLADEVRRANPAAPDHVRHWFDRT
ncbi:Rrf2 family transcriptional regulator [Streptomyces sp. K1PN6]|uniref:Rrf2 family transcriptional regulator n=1 Tax=Streptomyces acidicola TaxID=2596892 RepID=A0A5N8WRD1_9ACTN|nr:Rrf2 family transcriptional regulator [Streptomyces acidicola]